MKGFLACCLAALPAMLERPLREPLHIGLSYDEEVGCVGAPPFVASVHEAGLSPRLGFVGEPSMMAMIRGHKSINLVHVTLTGVPAHSSLTRSGVNAIEYAAEIVRYWRGRADAWKAHGPVSYTHLDVYKRQPLSDTASSSGAEGVPKARIASRLGISRNTVVPSRWQATRRRTFSDRSRVTVAGAESADGVPSYRLARRRGVTDGLAAMHLSLIHI